jgi:hypothetical protein
VRVLHTAVLVLRTDRAPTEGTHPLFQNNSITTESEHKDALSMFLQLCLYLHLQEGDQVTKGLWQVLLKSLIKMSRFQKINH